MHVRHVTWLHGLLQCILAWICEDNYKINDQGGCEWVTASIITGELYMYAYEHKHTLT